MTSHRPQSTPTRRSILKRGAVVAGGGLVAGSALAGSAAGSPRTNFAYVDSDVSVGEEVTLEERTGRPNLNCNDTGANIRTTAWKVSGDDDGTWYFIPNGYKGGETVEVVGVAIQCADSDLADKEVQVTQI